MHTARIKSSFNRLRTERIQSMELGTFSISLTVKDIEASRSFYEKLGFTIFAGDAA